MKSKNLFMKTLALGISFCGLIFGNWSVTSVKAGRHKSSVPRFKYIIFKNPDGYNEVYCFSKMKKENIILACVDREKRNKDKNKDTELQKSKPLLPPISTFDESLKKSGLPLFPDVDMDDFIEMMESKDQSKCNVTDSFCEEGFGIFEK